MVVVDHRDWCPLCRQRLDLELVVDSCLFRAEFMLEVWEEMNHFCLNVRLCNDLLKKVFFL